MTSSITKWARGLTASDRGKIIVLPNGTQGLLRNVEYHPSEGITHVDMVVGIDLLNADEVRVWE